MSTPPDEELAAREARWRLGDGNICFQCLAVFDWAAMVRAEQACISRCVGIVEIAVNREEGLGRFGRCTTEGRLCPACAHKTVPTYCFLHVPPLRPIPARP